MTQPPLAVTVAAVTFILSLIFPSLHAFGSGSTLAVTSGTSATVCGVAAANPTQFVICYQNGGSGNGSIVSVRPNISFSFISGGQNFLCGLRSGGYAFLCWNTVNVNASSLSFDPKRVYYNDTVLLQSLSVGDSQVCGIVNNTINVNITGTVKCWRGINRGFSDQNLTGSDRFEKISSGVGFSCGILIESKRIRCWGSNQIAVSIESQFGDMEMLNLEAGGSHVCGLNSTGFLVCKGDNRFGQLNVPENSGFVFSKLALGGNFSCGIRRSNQSVICWGGGGLYSANEIEGVFFESIVSGSNFVCGLTASNYSVLCWGPGWLNSFDWVPLPEILPGPCVTSHCSCGIYLDSDRLCGGSKSICRPCELNITSPTPLVPPPPAPAPPEPSGSSSGLSTKLMVFAIVGSVGGFAGICTVAYLLWTGACFGKKKVHNSVQPTITRAGSNGNTTSSNSVFSRSSTLRRQSSRAVRRQRSGTSSKHADRAEEFTLAELVAATDGFSLENKVGAGIFGVVYRGKLSDGREVAIKRGETGLNMKLKRLQEKESAFESELSFLSRLHHKHLVRLVGYCVEGDERLLVYEYMKNGALYDHLHHKNNVEKGSSIINSWKMRIKIALDAARGIEYLHNYAVPPIIHRDIKSSNILLDANWTARVSDFGLSLMGSVSEHDKRPMKVAGTVGYLDPEYYGLNVLSTKIDVYGFGVVLLELLTGKRAIFKNDDNGGSPVSVVDFAVPKITDNELSNILDPRLGPLEINEAEAVELVAYMALHCVNLEGKDRPTMTDIVANLDRALSLLDGSHGSISSGIISISSD